MKILTITGTRPEIIRLSLIIQELDDLKSVEHILVYTNQNFDPNLSDIFLKDLGIRRPNYTFPKTNSIGGFLSVAFSNFEQVLKIEKPDKVLVLGDTNSGLLAILASKYGIPVYHMEAGNRCSDNAVPEETNRKIIDSCSLFNLPYTENSKQNLINEGYHKNFVFKIGNPIGQVLGYYRREIEESDILNKIGLVSENGDNSVANPYALLTFHRTENVDTRSVSANVVRAINEIAEDIPVVFPYHPRTRDQFAKHCLAFSTRVKLIDPVGFFDFVKLEKYAKVIFTDSGTVPEEASLFHVPCIVLRNTTERQELMENGSLILAGTKKDDIIRAYKSISNFRMKWEGLDDYDKLNVSDTVIRLLVGQSVTLTRKGHDEY